jgi:hypothetical protein
VIVELAHLIHAAHPRGRQHLSALIPLREAAARTADGVKKLSLQAAQLDPAFIHQGRDSRWRG